jgi:hypothetical protein
VTDAIRAKLDQIDMWEAPGLHDAVDALRGILRRCDIWIGPYPEDSMFDYGLHVAAREIRSTIAQALGVDLAQRADQEGRR